MARAPEDDSSAPGDTERFVGHAPPFFDTHGLIDLAMPLVAAALAFGVHQRDASGVGPTDAAALILTVFALLTGTQALIGLMRLGQRLRLALASKQYRLTLHADALILETPAGKTEVAKDDILVIRERGHWGKRSGGRRYSPVFVVLRPGAGPTHLTLPPIFGDSPGVLAEALMRWRGPGAQAPANFTHPDPSRIASKVYDAAAKGKTPKGGVVVQHGRGWLARGPYVTALLGLALLLRAARFDEETAAILGYELVVLVAVAAALVPVVWYFLSLREVRPRKGLSLVITPAEVLIRTRRGVLRATFRNLSAPKIEERRSWSAILGLHTARTLVIGREGSPPIRYDEAFLGLPAEVVAGLLEAFKRGAVTATAGEASSAPG